MSSVPSTVLNDLFSSKLDTKEGQEKIAQFGGGYVRDRLREVSFSDKVVPVENVQRSELQRSEHHDTLVRIIDIEPNSRAMSMSFRGQPSTKIIRAPRYSVSFHTISSEKYEKTEQELMAYEMPVTKIIEANTVNDMQAIKDRTFLLHVEACIQGLQLEANGGTAVSFNSSSLRAVELGNGKTVPVIKSVIKGENALADSTDSFSPWGVTKNDFIQLKKLLHNRHLRAERILLTEADFDELSGWTIQDVWSIAETTAKTGWSSDTVLGLKIIRTIKTEVLRPGNIYCFTAPEFFGKNYMLNNTKFYIDKIANVITWQSWMDIGMGFGNVAAVVKLELYSGSVTPDATDTGFEAAIPKDESDMFPVNNRVDQGLVSLNVSQF